MKKYLKIGPYEIVAAVFVLLAVILRVALIAQSWPYLNSDEGTMGLEALHIAYHSELPAFLYGQSYMGVLEAYIGAALYHVFGVTPFALRLGLVFLFCLFLITMYFFVRFLYEKKLALVTLFLLLLGNANIITREVAALGGAVETLLFGSLSLFLTSWLVISFQKNPVPLGEKKRLVVYGLLGMVMGLGFWSDSLVIPFLMVSLALLLLFCRREVFGWSGVAFVLGTLIGAFPLLVYDIQHPADNIIWITIVEHSTGGTGGSIGSLFHFSVPLALLGTLLIDLPTATGAYPLCGAPVQQVQWPQEIPCMGFQGIWGAGAVILWGLATALLLLALYRLKRTQRAEYTPEVREKIARLTCRLALPGSALITLLAYTFSPAPAEVPFTSQRYLVGLLIVTPAIIAPLLDRISWPSRVPGWLVQAGTRLTLVFILVVMLIGTLNIFYQQVPAIQAGNQQQSSLVQGILALHTHDIYSNYWTCDRVIFQSDEQIICAVIGANLQPGLNRYPPYLKLVQQDPDAAYVFPTGSGESAAVVRMVAHSQRPFRRSVFAGFTAYEPLE